MFARAIVIVLDSVGIGELPDARLYEDHGSNTLGNIAAAVPLRIPNLAAMGLSTLTALHGVPARTTSFAMRCVKGSREHLLAGSTRRCARALT